MRRYKKRQSLGAIFEVKEEYLELDETSRQRVKEKHGQQKYTFVSGRYNGLPLPPHRITITCQTKQTLHSVLFTPPCEPAVRLAGARVRTQPAPAWGKLIHYE